MSINIILKTTSITNNNNANLSAFAEVSSIKKKIFLYIWMRVEIIWIDKKNDFLLLFLIQYLRHQEQINRKKLIHLNLTAEKMRLNLLQFIIFLFSHQSN